MVGAVTPLRIIHPLKTFMDSDSLKKKSSRSTKPSDIVVRKSSKTTSLSSEAIKLPENGRRRREASLSPEQPNRRSSLVDQASVKSTVNRTVTSRDQSTVHQSSHSVDQSNLKQSSLPTGVTAPNQSMVHQSSNRLTAPNQSTPTSQSTATLQRTFGHVVISLENLILPHHRLAPTPSMQEGLDVRTEWHLRRLGCDFIQHAGNILKLPQTAMATAQVLYQRFYYIKSFVRNDYLTMGMACVYLSSKVEESPKRLRDIINVFTHVRQVLCDEPVKPVILDYGYVNIKNQVIKCERRLLKELGFCVHVKHPHKLIYMYLRMLDFDMDDDVDRRFMQAAWNYMNDSLRTDLFVRYSPEAVACGCIYLATRTEKRPVPTRQAWYHVLFEVTEEDVKDIATSILLLYSIKMPPVKEVEEAVSALRTSIDKQRQQKGPLVDMKAAAADATPDSVRTDSPEEPRKALHPRSRSPAVQPAKRSRDRTPPPRRSRTRSPVYRRSPDRRRRRSRSSEERRRRERSREDRRRDNRERDRRRRHYSRSPR